MLADKGYDADYIIEKANIGVATAVIPPKGNGNNQRNYDKELYKERKLVERLFNKLKNFRRIATRYKKTVSSFMAFVMVAGIYVWLK